MFSYETASGRIDAQVLALSRPAGVPETLDASTITLMQGGREVSPDGVAADDDLEIRWSRARGMRARPGGLVDDLIFVLAFDCFGERVAAPVVAPRLRMGGSCGKR